LDYPKLLNLSKPTLSPCLPKKILEKNVTITDCSNLIQKIRPYMALTQERKQELISEFQKHETDTGSSELQVALLTERINQLSLHLRANPKDHSSRRGLLKLISQRKSLLSYIQKGSQERYQVTIARLGIRR
jgi:small subunit ribosomal protein S15